jgi:predicted DNA-binding protein (MmcQ/YjbR family)
MSVIGAREAVESAVLQWAHVEAHPHRFGGREYRIGRREIGHIHGDHLLDIPFPTKVRDEVIAAGLAEPHHLLPDTGWISFYFRDAADPERAIALLRRSYELALAQKGLTA